MTDKTSLQVNDSEADDAEVPSREAWAQMDQATIEAQIRQLADRGLDEAFIVMMSGQSINDVRRILGDRQ